MKRYLLIIFILTSLFESGQTSKTDSLKKLISVSRPDTQKVNLLTTLAQKMQFINPDSSILLYTEAAALSEKLLWPKGIIQSFIKLANFFQRNGDYLTALDYSKKALQVCERIEKSNSGDQEKRIVKYLKSKAIGNVGITYWYKGDFPMALECYLKGLYTSEELGNKDGIASAYANIALLYSGNGESTRALEYYLKAKKILEELHDTSALARNYGNIGLLYTDKKDYGSALKYHELALKFAEKTDDKNGIISDYGNIGNTYHYLNNFVLALQYYQKALKLAVETENKNMISIWQGNIGALYVTMKDFKKAEYHLLIALKTANEIGNLAQIKEWHDYLSELYEKFNKSEKALLHYKLFIAFRDSIFNEEATKKTVSLEMNYEFSKKEAASKLEQEKKEAVSLAESKKQKIIIWSVCGILILVIGFAVFAYRSFLQKQKANVEITKQKEIIEEKQKEILDSIRYAKRIQTTLLPSEKYIDKSLNKLNLP